jgi:organic radical activating enzyme
MNIAGTEYSLQTKSFDIFVSGCNRDCLGCFNPEAQDFNYGEPLDNNRFAEIMTKITDNDLIENIRIMGGDLLEQPNDEAYGFIYSLFWTMPKHKKLILYTGAEFKEIPQWCFNLFNAIKYGRYIKELHCDNPLYGSSNQHYIQKGVDY